MRDEARQPVSSTEQGFNPLDKRPYFATPAAIQNLPISVMTALQKDVYSAALNRFGKNRKCFASAETLANDVGAGERHTRDALYWLRDNGWIEIHKNFVNGRQTTNEITFLDHPRFAEWDAEQAEIKRQRQAQRKRFEVEPQLHPKAEVRVEQQAHPKQKKRDKSDYGTVPPQITAQCNPEVEPQLHQTTKYESSSDLTTSKTYETRNSGSSGDRKRAARSSSFKPRTDFSNRADDDQSRSEENGRVAAWPPQQFANPAEEIRAMVSAKVAHIRARGVEANLLSEKDEMELVAHLRNSGMELSDLVRKLREYMGAEWKNPVGLVKRTARDLRALTAKAPEKALAKPSLCIHCLGKRTVQSRDGETYACVCAPEEFIEANGLKRNEIVRKPRPEFVPSGSAA